MRADRLLALMMLLQRRGQMTAQALAVELDVSERTIYRDIDVLSAANVPIYASGGPGGGYSLLDSYRSTLTGLHADEVQALLMTALPGQVADLGLNQSLKRALLKLTSAQPDRYEAQLEEVQQRLYLDSEDWFRPKLASPYLKTIHEAIWQQQRLTITYQRPGAQAKQYDIAPYGLVAKAGNWYAVASTAKGMRVYRASRVQSIAHSETQFERDDTFDLQTYWAAWAAEYEASLSQFPVKIRLAPAIWPSVHFYLDSSVQPQLEAVSADANGWKETSYLFENEAQATATLLGMGAHVEVIAPDALRAQIAQTVHNMAANYAE